MWAALIVEARKLNRSLALLLAVAAPALIAIFLFFNILRGKAPQSWNTWMRGSATMWAFFMLPMSVTALATVVAHMEHGPRAWDQLRALPRPRWTIYAAKAASVLLLVGAMALLNLALSYGALRLASAIQPSVAPVGKLLLGPHIAKAGQAWLAAILLTAIQLWAAIRFVSFVPALALGIGGTFFAVVATAAEAGVYFPWQMPINVLAAEQWRADTALMLGGGVGALALFLVISHLSIREVR